MIWQHTCVDVAVLVYEVRECVKLECWWEKNLKNSCYNLKSFCGGSPSNLSLCSVLQSSVLGSVLSARRKITRHIKDLNYHLLLAVFFLIYIYLCLFIIIKLYLFALGFFLIFVF